MANEIISIIVPVYNAAAHLNECVKSILAQDHPDWELILVDDASTDSSPALCDRLAAEDGRIRVIHAVHGGAAAARNRGIEAAKGGYICFIDSDDTVEPDYLSYLYEMAAGYDADIACCGHDEPFGGARTSRPDNIESISPCSLRDLLYQRGLMSVPWGYLYRRGLWDEIRFPEGTEAEDMGTIYRLFMAADTAVKGSRICYHYIQHKGSTIYTTASSRRMAYYLHSRRMLHVIASEMPQYHPAAASRHFSVCAQNLSETPLGVNDAFIKRLYKDMARLSPAVLRDRDARIINRAAALIIRISPCLLRCMLRAYYRIKIWRMNSKKI